MQLRTAEIRADGSRLGLVYAPGALLAREIDFNGRATEYGYDDAGRLIGRGNAAGQRVSPTRDALGRVTRRRLEDDAEISYVYDAAGRLTVLRRLMRCSNTPTTRPGG